MPSRRIDCIDLLRGVALLWMTVFHFCFDLNEFGYLHQDLHHDPFWTLQRAVILSTFLLCAGMGQAVAMQQGQSWSRFWRRWCQIAGCALLVSAGSWLMFPRSFIYFGVLHGMALMLIVARCTAPWGNWLWPLGLVAIASQYLAPVVLTQTGLAELFNSPWLNWLGLITHKPITEDYVPVIPWLGLMWWGVAAGNWMLGQQRISNWQAPRRIQALATLGRWSLVYYMLHQPVMMGALMLVKLAKA